LNRLQQNKNDFELYLVLYKFVMVANRSTNHHSNCSIIDMFCAFIDGWSPIYITVIILPTAAANSLIISLLILLTKFSLLSDIINLYISNRDLRIFWKNKFFQLYL